MNTLEKIVFAAVNSAPELGGESDGRIVGATFMGICGSLGLSGTDRDVSIALDSLVKSGKIKKSPGFCDSIFYIEKEKRHFCRIGF